MFDWKPDVVSSSILETSDDCIKVLDLEGRLRFMSEGGQRVMEVDDFAALEGCMWDSFWRGAGADLARDSVAAARAGRSSEFLAPCATAKGTMRHWRVRVAPLRGTSGEIEMLLSISRDVTAEIEARDALKSSEARWRAMVDCVPQAIWSTDPQGRVEFMNRRWFEWTGMSQSEALGEGWAAALHPDDAPRVAAIWEQCRLQEKPYETEYRLRDGAGGWRAVLAQGAPVRGGDGAIQRWFGACTDVEELRRTQSALAAANARLDVALSASQIVGVYAFDIAADRLHPDARYCEIFGLPKARAEAGFSGVEAMARLHPDDAAHLREALERAMAGERLAVEFRVGAADEGWRWVLQRGRVETDGKGRARRVLGVVVDITERKLAEQQAQLASRELVHRIKNVFAVVNGMLGLTAREFPEAKAGFSAARERLNALAAANDMLRDGVEAASAHELLRRLAEPYRVDGEERIVVAGDDWPIDAPTATGLALIIHELATNAVKYGALSRETGRVAVTSRVEGGTIRLEWRELGGPEITDAPSRAGFGTVLAERTLAGLGGAMTRDWSRDGLVATVTMRARRAG